MLSDGGGGGIGGLSGAQAATPRRLGAELKPAGTLAEIFPRVKALFSLG